MEIKFNSHSESFAPEISSLPLCNSFPLTNLFHYYMVYYTYMCVCVCVMLHAVIRITVITTGPEQMAVSDAYS